MKSIFSEATYPKIMISLKYLSNSSGDKHSYSVPSVLFPQAYISNLVPLFGVKPSHLLKLSKRADSPSSNVYS